MAITPTPTFCLESIPLQDTIPRSVLGYFVRSTASINVEGALPKEKNQPEDPPLCGKAESEPSLQDIAEYIVASDAPEISISVHGYATSPKDAETRFESIYQYAFRVCQPGNHVFLGYIWPSEPPLGSLRQALEALPTVLIGNFTGAFILGIATFVLSLGILPVNLVSLLGLGLVGGILTFLVLSRGKAKTLLPLVPLGIAVGVVALALLSSKAWGRSLLPLLLLIFVFGFTLIFSLVVLRLITYFRDRYRATNYAGLDIVDLIRQLDQAILKASQKPGIEDLQWILDSDPQPSAPFRYRVKLNFLAHSMGCFVTTNAIRVLSDVFDPSAIAQTPNSALGKTLSLERLILAAPDIPVETAMSGRANVLQSSLRRCEEAYIFANEGDLALRLASTAANYFSYPTRTRFRGYRLGNLTVRHFASQSDHQNFQLTPDQFGIINLDPKPDKTNSPYEYLELRADSQEHQNLEELNDIVRDSPPLDQASIVNRFTVLDCTNYRDYDVPIDQTPPPSASMKPILSQALNKAALDSFDYISLALDFFVRKRVDTHGGYFHGQFSQKLMYDLLFIGFDQFLLTYRSDLEASPLTEAQKRSLLLAFSEDCQSKFIEVVLSPLRCQVVKD
jgi:hypothetical protein